MDPVVSETGRQKFADQLLIRLRKDLFLVPIATRDLAQAPIPTTISPMLNHNPPQRNDSPSSSERGIGLLGQSREQAERERSAEQFRFQPARHAFGVGLEDDHIGQQAGWFGADQPAFD